MTHRYPPTLTGNRDDLADQSYRQTRARQGPVTVREGEPGMILRDSNNRVVGRVGTGSDGRVGVSVDTLGAVQDIRNVFTKHETDVVYLNGQKDQLWATATNHEQRLKDDRSSITYLDGQREQLWTNVNNLWSDATSQDARITANRSSITYLDNNKASNDALGQVGQWATNAQNTANTANGTANTALSRANTAQSSANNAYDRGTQGVNAASNAQSTANTANSRAGDALSDAAAAAARASDARARADFAVSEVQRLRAQLGL